MKKEITGSVKVIPLGGLEQIGMNITAIECDDSIVVVDCGLSFPEEEMLGIDLIHLEVQLSGFFKIAFFESIHHSEHIIPDEDAAELATVGKIVEYIESKL